MATPTIKQLLNGVKDKTNRKFEDGKTFTMPSDNLDMSNVTEADLNEFINMIGYIETKNKDISQAEAAKGLRGEGIFQFESGPEGGGYTAINRAKNKLPSNVTADWLGRLRDDARNNNKSSFNAMEKLNEEDQKYLMAATVLLQDPKALINFSNASTLKEKKEILVDDYWAPTHWGGASTYGKHIDPSTKKPFTDPQTFYNWKTNKVKKDLKGVKGTMNSGNTIYNYKPLYDYDDTSQVMNSIFNDDFNLDDFA
tara:strand:- start:156 stop:917 length:762 start_codon:yes stop_codon:yes gene_type:complete